MAKKLFRDTTLDVSDLVRGVQHGSIALPELQRPYVWPTAKARDLFDSMYKGFPVGSLLFWQTGVDPGTRQVGTDVKQFVAKHLIVDGQQRLTSLYAVITGTPIVREDFTTRVIRLAFRPSDGTFAVPDAAIEQDPEFLPDISVLWQEGNRRNAVRGFLRRLRDKRAVDGDEEDRLDTALESVYGLGSYPFKIVELSDEVTDEEVADIFVRINSAGVKLNQADFILTLLSVYWDQGRKDLERFCRDSHQPSIAGASPFNWHITPDPAQLLRVTAVLAMRRAVLKQVYAVLRGRDADTGSTPSADRRSEQFVRLQNAQKHVLDLTNWHEFLQCLDRAGFRGTRMISSDNAVIYTYAMWLIGRVDHQVPLGRLRETLARWFFMAHTTSRYSGSFESQVEQDLGRLAAVAAGDAEGYLAVLDKVIEDTLTQDFWVITLPNDLDTAAAKSPTLMAYIAALNILDADALLSTVKVRSRLDPAIITRKGIERHHLFPRNYLKKNGVTDTKRINQIANMALVEWHDNIAISDDPPAAYWPRQLAAKNLPADQLDRQRRWHALPPDWERMTYEEFLPARRKLIAATVQEAFLRLSDNAYRPPEPKAPAVSRPVAAKWVRLSELVDAGLLKPGAVLRPKISGIEVQAVIDEDGSMIVHGEAYDSPSPAAVAAGMNMNGWLAWLVQLDDGPVPLDDLRSQYRALATS
ncbi:GmrSD restriction endonuclease domain-containing protein [Streptomyces sp. rh34]|uniref:GmrSD restriction endonuclease domain-containing protein n=1 Tax=Streptomyces sp. rh34 TaxID=2034272 RepID=UPI000BEFAF2C|nr:DUF262 domain-containing protein [Streptomyces sp. rh34]